MGREIEEPYTKAAENRPKPDNRDQWNRLPQTYVRTREEKTL